MEKINIVLDQSLIALYLVSAVCGGLGGCAVGSHYFMHGKQRTIASLFIYTILGIVFGIVTLAAMSAYHFAPEEISSLILWSLCGGAAGALALAGANASVRFMFRRLGIEVQVTFRKPDEDRRREGEPK